MDKITVENVDLTLGKNHILKDITVNFEEGMIHGLIGRNGSAKTMLMKSICGFVKPQRGKILVNGKQIGRDVDYPGDVGIIIETPGFLSYYSGFKNLKMLAGLKNLISDREIKETMVSVGLDPELKRSVSK